jgi:hypothetical protein
MYGLGDGFRPEQSGFRARRPATWWRGKSTKTGGCVRCPRNLPCQSGWRYRALPQPPIKPARGPMHAAATFERSTGRAERISAVRRRWPHRGWRCGHTLRSMRQPRRDESIIRTPPCTTPPTTPAGPRREGLGWRFFPRAVSHDDTGSPLMSGDRLSSSLGPTGGLGRYHGSLRRARSWQRGEDARLGSRKQCT